MFLLIIDGLETPTTAVVVGIVRAVFEGPAVVAPLVEGVAAIKRENDNLFVIQF